MSFDFESDWQRAKAMFEAITDKKKPGKKFLGVFKTSSGMEKACKQLTEAIESPTADRLTKAQKNYEKTSADYLKVLRKAADDDGQSDVFKAQLARLEAAIEQIRNDFNEAKQSQVEDAFMPFADIVPQQIVEALTKSGFPSTPVLLAFATKPQFGVSGADGKTKLPDLAAAQQKAKDSLKAFLTAMKAMKDQAKKSMDRKEAWTFAEDRFGDANVAVHTEGFLNAVAQWKNAQEHAFHEAGISDEDEGKWMNNGPLTALIQQITTACEEEGERLRKLERYCGDQAKQPRRQQ